MIIAQFFKASLQKKIRSITSIVWLFGRVEKNAEKREKMIFLNKYHSVTHVSTCIFQGLFKIIDFRSVVLNQLKTKQKRQNLSKLAYFA